MKKLKKIWNENRVLMVLAMVLLACFIVVIIVALTYFYGSSKSPYGNRLDGIDEVKITDKIISNVTDKIEENSSVKSAKMKNIGKMIYLSISFVDGTTIDAAKPVAETAMTYFSKDELNFYDINITIKCEGAEGFTLMGAKNSGGSGVVVWNNNTPEEKDDEGAES